MNKITEWKANLSLCPTTLSNDHNRNLEILFHHYWNKYLELPFHGLDLRKNQINLQ